MNPGETERGCPGCGGVVIRGNTFVRGSTSALAGEPPLLVQFENDIWHWDCLHKACALTEMTGETKDRVLEVVSMLGALDAAQRRLFMRELLDHVCQKCGSELPKFDACTTCGMERPDL